MFKRIVLGKVDLSNVPNKYRWYTIVTQFNYEAKYIQNVKEAVEGTELEKYISDYYIPIKYTKKQVTLVDGTKKDKIHKVKGAFSNYVFIKCILTERIWNLLRGTTGVAVIPTVGGIPQCLTQYDIDKIKEEYAPEGFSEEELKKLNEKQAKYHIFDTTIEGDLVNE